MFVVKSHGSTSMSLTQTMRRRTKKMRKKTLDNVKQTT